MASTINALTSGGGVAITGDTSGQLQLQTNNGTTAVTIDASQNVGIGTSSPAAKLDVSGAGNLVISNKTAASTNSQSLPGVLDFSGSGWNTSLGPQPITGRIALVGAYDTTPGNVLPSIAFSLQASNSSLTERMRIDSSGNLLVGTTNAGGRTATIVNTSWYTTTTAAAANMVVASDGTVYRSTSALKYKTDIRDLPSIDINKFRPVVYKSNAEFDDKTKEYFGVIADEVDKAGIKELVNYGAEGEVEGFQYERLTVVLLKAIQELKAIVDSQAERIATLEAK
jgi:hypothetical protein